MPRGAIDDSRKSALAQLLLIRLLVEQGTRPDKGDASRGHPLRSLTPLWGLEKTVGYSGVNVIFRNGDSSFLCRGKVLLGSNGKEDQSENKTRLPAPEG